MTSQPNPYFDGMGWASALLSTTHPGVEGGFILHALAQEGLAFTPAALAANEMVGAVSLPAVNVGVVGTVDVVNTLYTVNTGIWLQVVNGNGDATAGLLAVLAQVENRAVATNTFRIRYTPLGANMGAAWWANYLLIGKM